MNRQVEGFRGVSRASAVAGLTRDDFYAAAISSAYTESEGLRNMTPQVQAAVDARHPSQTGGLQ